MAGQGKSIGERSQDEGSVPLLGGMLAVCVAIAIGIAAGQAIVRSGIVPEHRFTTEVREGELEIMPRLGVPLPLEAGEVEIATSNGNVTLPLTAISRHTVDGKTWRAGDAVCFVGDDPECLRPPARNATITIRSKNDTLYRSSFELE